MYVQTGRNGRVARRLVCFGALTICGCGGSLGLVGDNGPRTTLGSSILQAANEAPYYEGNPNNFLETAEPVQLEGEPRIIHGQITGPQDVDVYDLGPARAGDHIVVEMTPDASLDGAVAIFDDSGASLLINDHRNVYLGRNDPFIDVVIRRTSQSCYLAASATPGYGASGAYTLLSYKEGPVPVPSTRPNVVLLVFSGGSGVRIGTRPPIEVPPFDTTDIGPGYAGRTSAIIERIVDGVREDYTGFDVTILSTSEGARFEAPMTRIFFGTFDSALLGVAEGVDEFNSDPTQEAIVFTDTFAAFLPLSPTASEMARAIANVAAHELGHLLGLVHTSDPAGIMDVTASLRDLLANQDFRESPIYSDVFPLGYQDAVQSLLDTVGGDSVLTLMKYVDGSAHRRNVDLEPTGPPVRAQFYLSSCGLDEH